MWQQIWAGVTWQPGIGDPSFMGWLTVGAYALAAIMAAIVWWRQQTSFWAVMALILAFLCLNKQLDLQSLMTDIGRQMAKVQGWQSKARVVQAFFVGFLGTFALISTVIFWRWSRGVSLDKRIAAVGMLLLGAFIVIRASSFHHMDSFIGWTLLGAKMNWLLELGGIAIITLGAIIALVPRPGSSAADPDTLGDMDLAGK